MDQIDKLAAWSTQNVQEETLVAVKKYIPAGKTILELGAGTGRLSVMLKDAGYQITAGDWNSDQFVPKNIECHQVDCDDSAWLAREFGARRYDAIVCGDLIEHLKNPFRFIETISGFLTRENNGGYLFVTTPNILSPQSRSNLLVNGNPLSFGSGGLEMGHINPMFPNTMKIAFRSASLECLDVIGVGKAGWLGEKSYRGFCLSLITTAWRTMMRRVIHSPVLLFVGRVSASSMPLTGTPIGTGKPGHYSSNAVSSHTAAS